MQSCYFNILSESEFQSVLELDISDEDKAHIFTVITRLQRILNGNSCDEKRIYDRQNGPRIIREILIQFYRWKETLYQPDAFDVQKQHLIIFSLAKLSLYYWITDSTIVAEILRELYECDGHFSSMFAHIVNRHDVRSLLRHSADCSKRREDSATIFFLHHSNRSKLEFNGVRFYDLRLRFPMNVPPVFLAAVYSKSHVLLHLLRFGAEVDAFSARLLDDWNLPMLLRHLIRILWNSLGEDLDYFDPCTSANSSVMSRTVHQTAECFCIILRAIRQIRMEEMDFLLMKFEGGVLSGSVRSHDYIRQLSEKGIIPKLVNRYLEPSELRHLCRCVIRHALNASWNLPYGICLLPLPTFLKNYLSLLKD